MATYKQVPVERLHEVLEADFENGTLAWRFRENIGHPNKVFNGKFAGKRAGNKTSFGYTVVEIDRVSLLVHRVLWAMRYGAWPKAQLDHINHERSDNRISNLREVSHAENMRNLSFSEKNQSGVTGVFWRKKNNKWQAQIKTGGVCYYLGMFDCLEEAKQARLAANKRFEFYKNHGVEAADIAA